MANLVGEHAAAGVAVEGVAPERLDREGGAAHRDVRRRALARADPGAHVAILGAAAVQPAAIGEDVRLGLGELVAADDGDAVRRAGAVDEPGAAARARVGDVGHVGVGDVAVARAGGAMPGAILRLEALRVVAGRGVDHILDLRIRARAGVAEVARRPDRLAGELRLAGSGRRRARIVVPDPGQHAAGVRRVRAARAAEESARGHALAVLGDRVVPGAAAHVTEEILLDGG